MSTVAPRIGAGIRLLLMGCLLFWSSVALGQQADPIPNPKPAEPKYWTTNWELNDVDVGKLSDMLQSVGINVGVELQGTVSVDFEVGVPITSLRDPAAYRFDGSLASPSLVIDGVKLQELETEVTYRNGTATLQNLKSDVIDREQPTSVGRMEGEVSAKLVPRRYLEADLVVQDVPTAPIADLLAKYLGQNSAWLPQGGSVTGKANLSVPLATMDDIATYSLEGKLRGSGLRLGNLPPADFDVQQVQIANQRLTLEQFILTAGEGNGARSIRLLGNAGLSLVRRGAFHFEVMGDDVPVGDVLRLLANSSKADVSTLLEGKLDFRLSGQGELKQRMDESEWTIAGDVASPQLTVSGIDVGTLEHHVNWTPSELRITPIRNLADLPGSFRIGGLEAKYSILKESLVVEELKGTLFDGKFTGTAKLPFTETGIAVANLNVVGMKPKVTVRVGGRKLGLACRLEGDIDWRVPMNALDQPVQHSGQAELSFNDVTIGQSVVGNLAMFATASEGQLSIKADGALFDGSIQVATQADLEAADTWSDVPARLANTSLKMQSISIERALKSLLVLPPSISGVISGEVTILKWIQSDPMLLPDADIQLELSRLAYRSRPLSRSLRFVGNLKKKALHIQSFSGEYAGGDCRVNGQIQLLDNGVLYPRADLRVSVNRMHLSRGLWFLGGIADDYEGRASLSATIGGSLDSMRVRGNAEGRELVFYDLPLGKAHSAMIVEASLTRGSWKVRFPTIRSSQGGGRVEGELVLASSRSGGGGVDLLSRWHTRRVDFVRLTQQLGRSNSLAHGEITGDLTLNGKKIQGWDDLAGRFDFRLGRTQGGAIPGLLGVSRFLGPVSLVSETFDVGQVKGVIGAGAVQVDEFWIGSDTALVRADGKVFLRSGRMDLNALIATGDYRDIAANFTQLAQQYALRSWLPASAILDVSDLLRDRTLVVGLKGSFRDPIVVLRPVQTFREEAARFLLREGQRLALAGISASAD